MADDLPTPSALAESWLQDCLPEIREPLGPDTHGRIAGSLVSSIVAADESTIESWGESLQVFHEQLTESLPAVRNMKSLAMQVISRVMRSAYSQVSTAGYHELARGALAIFAKDKTDRAAERRRNRPTQPGGYRDPNNGGPGKYSDVDVTGLADVDEQWAADAQRVLEAASGADKVTIHGLRFFKGFTALLGPSQPQPNPMPFATVEVGVAAAKRGLTVMCPVTDGQVLRHAGPSMAQEQLPPRSQVGPQHGRPGQGGPGGTRAPRHGIG